MQSTLPTFRNRRIRAQVPATPSQQQGLNPLTLAWIASLWLATLANWPLWRALASLPEMASWRGHLFMLALGGMVTALCAFVLTLAAWRWSIKPAIALFLVTAAAGAHFMGAYSAVIDASMMLNVLQTDLRESRDLFSLQLVITALVLAVAPLVWLARVPVQRIGGWRQLRRNLLGAVGAIALTGGLLVLFYADMSATMRNHKSVRYLVNPLNSFYALGVVAAQANAKPSGPPAPVGQDAHLVPHATASRPPLLLLVLGETARADHFSLNGYARTTTPELAALGVLNFSQVTACGTSTAASLPCMFSVFGKAGHEAQAQPHENVLDVLHRAGLAVLWVDNQAGCKGVCDRVAHVRAADPVPGREPAPAPPLCAADGECFDEALLQGLDERIAALPAERRERGVVVVLHQMGSHGPAYWKRSPNGRKPFQPECETNVLQECDPQALINSYDNSIAYTDHLLAGTIGWLKAHTAGHETALLYLSDHGESLGENHLYLHGLPYALAPREQKHVPMVMWLSQSSAGHLRPGCLKDKADTPLSHDNLSHTLLGLMGVQTQAYQESLDIAAPCRLTQLL